jgi:hypothetical protein
LVHKQLFEDHDFSIKLNATERRAWEAFKNVCGNFLGNEEAGGFSNVKIIRIALNLNRKREKIFADQCHLDYFGSV